MTPEQKQRAIKLIAGWRAVFWRDAGNDMADLLQELIDAPEQAGVPDVAIKRAASEMYRLGYGYHESHAESILLAAAPEAPAVRAYQSEQHLEMVNAPAPSVPVLTVKCEPDYWSGGHYYEGTKPYIAPTAVWKLPIGTKLYTAPPAPSVPDEQLQAAFDRGLKAGNEQSVAQQIEIHKLHDSLAAPQPEQPADLVRDAERYRWLRDPSTDVATVIDKKVGWREYDEQTNTGGYGIYEYRGGDELDAAIDEAIERDLPKGNKNG